MTAIDTIIAKLNEVFAPMDEEVLIATKKWAKNRVKAIREFKNSDEAKQLRKNQHAYYTKLFALAGGKTWYNVFDGRTEEMIEQAVTKICKANVDKRNANIATKLVSSGVTEVLRQEFAYTVDGFDGVFIVNTDAGVKRVSINTIRAGGYNVQCLHLRVLVKVK